MAQALAADVREGRDLAPPHHAEGEGKSLKNAASARRVPHPALVAEGVPAYVAGLAPDAPSGPEGGPFGDLSAAYSKRAVGGSGASGSRTGARWRTTRGGTGSRTCAGVSKDVHDRLTGHSEGDVSGATDGARAGDAGGGGPQLPLPRGLVVDGYDG